jgi:hypothetical protein
MSYEDAISPKFYLAIKTIFIMEKKAAKEKIKVNDVVVDKMSEYFKVQDKSDLYRYMKANKIYNSEEPA